VIDLREQAELVERPNVFATSFPLAQASPVAPRNSCQSQIRVTVDMADLIERIYAFGAHYSALGRLFNWTFTRQELEHQLRDPLLHLEPSISLHTAA
jgi:hypothetical protein